MAKKAVKEKVKTAVKTPAKKSSVVKATSPKKKTVTARKKTLISEASLRTVPKKKISAQVISEKHITPKAKDLPAVTTSSDATGRRSQCHRYEYDLNRINKVNLPLRYHDNRLVLLVRDPWWMHAYWDISDQRYQDVISAIPHDKRTSIKKILRVYNLTQSNGRMAFYDLEINDYSTSWYINANSPESSFCVELGYVDNEGKFYLIVKSNVVNTPYYGISDSVDEEWMTLSDEQYAKILGLDSFDISEGGINLSSAEFQQSVRERFNERLSSLLSSAALSSAEMTGSSELLGSSEIFGSSEILGASEQLLSSESVQIRRGMRRRKFFLEVYTDVIVYGRTEPDASVTFRGEPIKLAPDGTFRFRYHMPIGDYDFPVCATSSDEVDTITIEPQVTRRTRDNKPYRIDTEGFEKKSV